MQNIVPPIANAGPTLDASNRTTSEIGIVSVLAAAPVLTLSCATIAEAMDFTKRKITNFAIRSTINVLDAVARARFQCVCRVTSIARLTR